MTDQRIPPRLQEVVDEFADLPKAYRLEALLDYSGRLPELPPHLAANRDGMEQVPECQTPFFLSTELDPSGVVTLWFDAPPESPTTRGFAGILWSGLDGATADEVLGTPDNFSSGMGLAEVVSPLRMRAMAAILSRVKRRVRVQEEVRRQLAGRLG